MKVVSDTTTLIAFLGLGRMSVLKELFGKLAVPKAVYDELHQKAVPPLDEWAEVIEIKDRRAYRSYRGVLGAGESEALCLCRQIDADAILLDDRRARLAARRISLKTIGTLGVLLPCQEERLDPGSASGDRAPGAGSEVPNLTRASGGSSAERR